MKKTIAYILIIVGAIGLLISLTADITGLGADPLNFGWKQILGTTVGALIVIAGIVLLVINPEASQSTVSRKKTEENKGDLL